MIAKSKSRFLISLAAALGLVMGFTVPASQATSSLDVTFPSGFFSFTAGSWESIATVTSVTPLITGTVSPDLVRVTVDANLNGKLRLDTTTGVAASAGFDLNDFDAADATGASKVSFTGTVAQANASLASVEFNRAAHGNSDLTITVSPGAGFVLGNSYYEVYTSAEISWTEAFKQAASKKVASNDPNATYECQGYLATIETATEQELISANARADAWIGGSDEYTYVNASITPGQTVAPFDDQDDSEGSFHWVVGPSRGVKITTSNDPVTTVSGTYNNWNANEPNNSAPGEHAIQLLGNGLWNDLAFTNDSVDKYIVEYGGLRTITTNGANGFQASAAAVNFANASHMGDIDPTDPNYCVPAAVDSLVSKSFTAVSSLASYPEAYDAAGADLDFDMAKQKLGSAAISNLIDQTAGLTADIGVAAGVGDFFDYYDVITIGGVQIDARITITAQQGMESSNGLADDKVRKLDDYTSTTANNRYLNTDLTYTTGTGDQYVEFEIEFFVNLAGTPIPVILENFLLSTYDIDSYQYLEASQFDRYYFGTDTILSASAPRAGVTRFGETEGTSSSSSNMNSRVTLEFDSASKFVLRLGQDVPAGQTEDAASFVLDFGSGTSWGGAQEAAELPPVFVPGAAPYLGPILEKFSTRDINACSPSPVTITGQRLSSTAATVQSKSVRILESSDSRLVIELPAGLSPENGADLVLESAAGRLTFQNAFNISSESCAQAVSKGRWTQLQADGKTVKIYAKDPIGDGKIQFFVDGKEIAWINAVDESDPTLRFANDSAYLVRTVKLKPGKNRFEIKLNDERVWRATYVPKG